jgi:hypothetical protein
MANKQSIQDVDAALDRWHRKLSGHSMSTRKCPLLGVKRTLVGRAPMSASDPKRTKVYFGARSPYQ